MKNNNKTEYTEKNLPYGWKPRTYQKKLFDSFPKAYIPDGISPQKRLKLEKYNQNRYNNAYIIKTRRYGFDLTCLNIVVKESQQRVGVYYHIFPTYAQGKKDLWNGRTKEGKPFLDYIPKEIVKNINNTEMIVYFRNKSLYQVVGSDRYDCYDEKTEILTKNGWKYFKDIEENEIVATLNNGYLEYEKIDCKMEYDYNGEMYRVKSGSIDLLTTPNHKYYVKSKKGVFKFKEIKNKTILNDLIPATAKWKGKNIKYFKLPEIIRNSHDRSKYKEQIFRMKDWCAFMGIYLSEGSISNSSKKGIYQICIAQSQDTNLEKVEDIKYLLKKMGLNYYYSGKVFQILNKQLFMYLKKFGKCYDKYIPRNLLELSPKYLRILKDWLIKGDGHICKYKGNHKDYETYQTTSKKLIDNIQELIIKLGYSGNIKIIKRENKLGSKIKGRQIKAKRTLYSIGIRKSKYKYFKNNREEYIKKEHYKGKVYCVDVQNHIVKVRRNGFEAWCGNSLRGAGVVGVILSEWAYMDPNCLNVISPMLAETGGWMIFGTTPFGYNHAYRDYLMAKSNHNYYTEICTADDAIYYEKDYNGNIVEKRAISKEAIEAERARGMSGAEIQREYFASFEAPVEGAYYENEIMLARKQGRITGVRPQATVPVHTFWDLGWKGSTAIWFVQFIGNEIHLVNYYENNRKPLSYYANYLKDWRNENEVTLGTLYLPHDAEAHRLSVGTSIMEDFQDMGFECDIVKRPTRKEDGHEACRQIFGQCFFDEKNCKVGISALSSYHSKYSSEKQDFNPRRVEDWSAHGADGFQTLALFYKTRQYSSIKKPDYSKYYDISDDLGGWMAD